jgi:RHS repeat-associated protein
LDSFIGGGSLVCGTTDGSGTTAYKYDLLGRITEVTETRGALSFVTAYSYDLAGVLTDVTLPSGRVISYARNNNGQTSGVTADVAGSPVNLAQSITYLPFGPAASMTYGSTLNFIATYDQNYWPLSRAVSTLYNHSYTTDDTGNITQIGSTDYGYDALNRLNAEDSGSATAYTYDATSNRLTKTSGSTVTTTVPATSNKISAVGGDSYTYDAAGNITGDGVREYVWDTLNRLTEVKISASTVGAYTYNTSNQRSKKIAGGVTTHYVYGAGGLLYGEYDNSGNFIREYVYLNGAPLAQINAGSPETLTYLHTDHLGTPKFGTDATGTQVWVWAPDAFGGGAPSGSVTVNLRMAGQYYDAESTLFYNWNRYYNPATGRYISSDPIGLDGGINTFLYAAASPVMYIDPEGLDVYVCSRPIDLAWVPNAISPFFPKHSWIKTDTYEAGMGGLCPIPGQGCADIPHVTKVTTIDHSGQSNASNSTCKKMQNIDESCVNKRIALGQSLGTWGIHNNCSSFTWGTISQCSYGLQTGPALPLCTITGPDPDIYGPQLPRCERGSIGTTFGP